MQILIAEDDENSRILLESILLSLGHSVLVANDGGSARTLLEHEIPDMVISDILMPGIDGFELCRYIRQQPRLKKVPIIIYSATYIDRKDEELAIAAGANRFVVKPVEPLKLVQMIDEVAREHATPPATNLHSSELDAMHIARLQAKLRRKLIQLGRDRSALRSSQERLRLALEAAQLGVFDWRADTDEIMADPTIHRLLLGKPGILRTTSRAMFELVHPGDREQAESLLTRMRTQKTPGKLACRVRPPDGRQLWIEIYATRMPEDSFSAPARVIGVMKDVTQEKTLEERLNRTVTEFDHLASHDALTGLPNRLSFNDALDQAIQKREVGGPGFAVLLMDLDAFGVINDSLGHAMGDALLVLLAERLRVTLHPGDFAARLGGDEFGVILPGVAGPEALAGIARKLLFALNAPVEIDGEKLRVSASIGLCLCPQDGEDRHALLKAADTAMYAAKAEGRNRYSFHTEEMAVRATELHAIEQGLKRALEEHQLVLHYQPQVNLITGALTGVEALVRWMHPKEGLIPPGRFIPIAEASGLIDPIGRWVLRAACLECASWMPQHPGNLQLSVNVSARQLINENFVELLRATLEESGLPARCLELELTESTLQVIETSPRLLEQIRALGITLAIDDFGTGYSSLSVLKHLPIDRLKVDRSFVRDMPGDANDIAITTAIIGLSRSLGLSIVAEGVETADQLDILRQLGCEIGQGFLFSRPIPADALRIWISENGRAVNTEATE